MITILAAISAQSLIQVFVWVVVAAVIYWLITWGIAQIGIPEPFNRVLRVILVVVVVLVLINALLILVGRPLIAW